MKHPVSGVRGCVVLVLSGSLACSTTATVVRTDGTRLEGTIEGGGPDHITLRPKLSGNQQIPRRQIKDIDHPGNVHAIIGGVVIGYGAAVVAGNWDECREREEVAMCGGMFLPAAVGVGMLIWGLGTWLGSSKAADDTSAPRLAEPPPLKPVPTLPPAPPPPPSASAPPPPVEPPLPAAPPAPPAPTETAPAPSSPPPGEPAPGGVVW
jgi:hypothetical protein